MRIRFLGTRGEIELRTARHRRHSALLVSAGRTRVMIDCGLDWLGELGLLRPEAIALTHAHPDHAGGLRAGASCPVLATAETWRAIGRYAIPERVTLEPRVPVAVGSLSFVAFPVDHSLRAPAVGYRLEAGTVAVFYAPDVVAIHDRAAALGGIRCYLGDGASVTRGIVRRRNGTPIGHASIRTQLDWCAEEGVGRAIFTHCGSQILRDEARGRPRSRHSRKTVASPRVSRTTT